MGSRLVGKYMFSVKNRLTGKADEEPRNVAFSGI